jgi:hypothetical protein
MRTPKDSDGQLGQVHPTQPRPPRAATRAAAASAVIHAELRPDSGCFPALITA